MFLARLRWEAIEALRARAHRLWRRVRIAFWTGVACIHFVRARRRKNCHTMEGYYHRCMAAFNLNGAWVEQSCSVTFQA